MASGDTRTQEFLNLAATGTRADVTAARGCCNTRTQDLILDVADRIITEEETRAREDAILQGEIDEIKNNPDVADIVATYADLQNYDTSTLTNNDIIRVLRDETHDGASTFYRWNVTTQTFTYIGDAGDYYTKAQADALLATKADKATTYTKTETDTLLNTKQNTLTAGSNITITNDTISATDTTYSDFVGTDGTAAGTAGLVPAPATTDAGKFLKADGTWGTVQAGPTVVQTTGTSATDVMSQNATTSMVYADPSTRLKVQIGDQAQISGYGVAIGAYAKDNTGGYNFNTLVGHEATVNKRAGTAIGSKTFAGGIGSIALGYGASTSIDGQMTIVAQDNLGYNNTNYRLLTGLYDPQSDHDAATKGYVDTAVASAGATTLTNAEFNAIFGTSLTEGA